MKKLLTIALTSTTLLVAPAALAAPTLTAASLTGPTGTVWNTTVDSYYTLFLSRPYGNVLNPNDNFSGTALVNPVQDEFDFAIAGDGFPTAVRSSTPSDPYYTLNLTLSEGGKTGMLSGVFTEATATFTPTAGSVVFASGTYSLIDFTWSRTLSNNVGAFSSTNTMPIGPGSRADYQGAFTLTSTPAVPEPATWAMMVTGFAMVGFGLRAHRRSTKISFA